MPLLAALVALRCATGHRRPPQRTLTPASAVVLFATPAKAVVTVAWTATAIPVAIAEPPAPTPPSPATIVPPAADPPPPPPAPTRAPDDLLRFVGKTGEALPLDYVPPDLDALPLGFADAPGRQLRREVAGAFQRMALDARRAGVVLVAASAYRSSAEQAFIYSDEVRLFGKARADREVALPGRSEHQLGTTVDISIPGLGYQLDDILADLPEGRWLQINAADYGFILSYPAGKEAITGYRYEPWHYRYVGVVTARYIAGSSRTSTEVLQEHQTAGDDPVVIHGPLKRSRVKPDE